MSELQATHVLSQHVRKHSTWQSHVVRHHVADRTASFQM